MSTRVVEGKKPYRGGTAIEITHDKIINLLLREANNLLHVNGNNELYCDLQLDDELRPTSDFPVGVTTGRIIEDNGWDRAGTILCVKTTSGDNIKLVYTDEGEIWIDNGTGIFKRIYLKQDVDDLLEDYVYKGLNQIWDDNLEIEIGLWYESSGSDYSSQHIVLDPKGALKTYYAHGSWINEGKLEDGELELEYRLHNDTHKDIKITRDSIIAENTTNIDYQPESQEYPFWGDNRIAKLSDINALKAVVDTTAPNDPFIGQLWYDTTNTALMIYDGTQWIQV